MSDAPRKPLPPLASVHTDSLTEILTRLGASLLVSTYQTGKVIVARVEHGEINTHFRAFETPMGMACDNGRLAIGARNRVWDFRKQHGLTRTFIIWRGFGDVKTLIDCAQSSQITSVS